MEWCLAMRALRGILSELYCMEQVKTVLSLILSAIGCHEDTADDVIKEAFQFYDETDEARITHIVCNTVEGDRHISLVIGTRKYPVPKNLDTDEGVFAYVYNADDTTCSELGYIFFEKRNGGYHRIG